MFHNVLISIPTLTTYYCVKYYFIKKQLKDNAKTILAYVGGLVFGIMLIENILRAELVSIYITLSPYIGSLLSCGIYVLAVFLVGAIITAILKRIPWIKKLI